ncbi:MAG: NAD-dependent epimerase/dehydratase family protein [Bacteroidetes bacterium]|nr:NAD-dependent epimerase/dehydratase family protein [Bacteroidota bacterium]
MSELKVVVTGGSGFLGSHVLRELRRRQIPVKALVNKNRLAPEFSDVEQVSGDLSDPEFLCELLEGCTSVIHCAAVISFRKSRKTDLFESNSTGTRNLVNAALVKGIKRFVHIGSIASTGAHYGEGVIDEEFMYNLKSLRINYSISKYHADHEVMRGSVEGLEGIILSPGNIIGPDDLRKSTLKNLKLALRNSTLVPDGGIGLVDVRDVAWVAVEALEKGKSGERYILISENYTYGHYVDLVTGTRKKRKTLPGFIYKGLGYFFEGMESLLGIKMPFTVEKSRLHHYFFWGTGKKAETTFGFTFRPAGASMKETLDWYRSQKYL